MSEKAHFTAEARAAGERVGIDWVLSQFDVEQFRMGMYVELEHGIHDVEKVTDDDVTATAKIARAHLNEFPDYNCRPDRHGGKGEGLPGPSSSTRSAMTGYRRCEQRELVGAELARLAGLARALDRAIATVERSDEQQEETMFDGFDPGEYEDQARECWGRTDAHKESARRVASYEEEQWRAIKAQEQEIERFAELKWSAQPADSEPTRAAAEQARLHIDRWFYPAHARCTGRSGRCTSPTLGSRRVGAG